MDAARRERRAHGTQGFPFQIYSAPQAQDSDLVPYHWHPETEIIIVLHGTVGVTIADRQYAGQEGDVFFASSGQLHEIRGGVDNRFRASRRGSKGMVDGISCSSGGRTWHRASCSRRSRRGRCACRLMCRMARR